jgi:hypothetical protein
MDVQVKCCSLTVYLIYLQYCMTSANTAKFKPTHRTDFSSAAMIAVARAGRSGCPSSPRCSRHRSSYTRPHAAGYGLCSHSVMTASSSAMAAAAAALDFLPDWCRECKRTRTKKIEKEYEAAQGIALSSGGAHHY